MNRVIPFIKAHKRTVAVGLIIFLVLAFGAVYAVYRLSNNNPSASAPQTGVPVSYPVTGVDPASYPVTTIPPISYPVTTNNGQPEVNLFFASMYGEISTSFAQTIMPQGHAQWVLDATGANLINDNCKLTTTYTAPGKAPTSYTGPLNLMPGGRVGLNTTMPVGEHEFKAECVVNGKTYTAVATAVISAYAASSCVTPAPDTSSTAANLTDLREKVVGTWRGCMRWFNLDPDMAYQVEFTFDADGTYTASNYEKVVVANPAPMYENPATYWGGDNQTLPYLIQSIDDSGTGFGTITLFSGNEGVNLNKVQVDGDNLHFEIKYDSYGPLVYDMVRVSE
jgi:hypothetical protein